MSRVGQVKGQSLLDQFTPMVHERGIGREAKVQNLVGRFTPWFTDPESLWEMSEGAGSDAMGEERGRCMMGMQGMGHHRFGPH